MGVKGLMKELTKNSKKSVQEWGISGKWIAVDISTVLVPLIRRSRTHDDCVAAEQLRCPKISAVTVKVLLEEWYEYREFGKNKNTLVIVVDGRRFILKENKARIERDRATSNIRKKIVTLQKNTPFRFSHMREMHGEESKLCVIDSDVLFNIINWANEKDDVFVFGSPYEGSIEK